MGGRRERHERQRKEKLRRGGETGGRGGKRTSSSPGEAGCKVQTGSSESGSLLIHRCGSHSQLPLWGSRAAQSSDNLPASPAAALRFTLVGSQLTCLEPRPITGQGIPESGWLESRAPPQPSWTEGSGAGSPKGNQDICQKKGERLKLGQGGVMNHKHPVYGLLADQKFPF